jgi:hypothetical protein
MASKAQWRSVPDPEAEHPRYRTVSRLAMVSLVLAILSSLALLRPLLWIVPFTAAALAVCALASISRRSSELSGRTVALLALAIALMIGVWAPTRHLGRERYLTRQAAQYSRQWLELLHEGRLYDAHQHHLPLKDRAKAGTSLEEEYEKRDTQQEAAARRGPGGMYLEVKPGDAYDEFFDQPIPQRLAELGARARYEFLGIDGVNRDEREKADTVQARYRVDYEEDSQPHSFQIRVVVVRELQPESNEGHWFIAGVSEVSGASAH